MGKARAHFYKPIQIAEVLYRDRVVGDIDLSDLETYRKGSKQWRDEVSLWLVGRKCTSSAKYQDDVFSKGALPPSELVRLGVVNRATEGAVESHIYSLFSEKNSGISQCIEYVERTDYVNFRVENFLSKVESVSGLKRSVGKIYECLVYALFQNIVQHFDIDISLKIDLDKLDLIKEFSDFAEQVLCISEKKAVYEQKARFHRVGVTNAADRGIDIWGNFGTIIQIKHISLNVEDARDIVSTITADRIVIVCRAVEKDVIESLLTQIGWRNRIQSIITLADLLEWYEKSLRGEFSSLLGESLLMSLSSELSAEFPNSVDDRFASFKEERNYHFEDVPSW